MAVPFTTQKHRESPFFRVLGVPVNAIQIPGAIAVMEEWIQRRETTHYVAVTGMHGVVEALHQPTFKTILEEADLVVPDGMPLVWMGRRQGFNMPRRVYGPELMETFFRVTQKRYSHFFYGGAPGVADELAKRMRELYGIMIAGTWTPPFRELTFEEQEEVSRMIQSASPDVLWVGLSTPKQEKWMWNFRDRVSVPVMVGVGAAFDFHTGRVRQAPRWMREHGLEWLFRLASEPRRLWRRYLIYGSQFVWNVNLEILKLRKFS
ncbi:MAG TPA: WecB/TagA/CpsF family glycosyltransferase [Terriglobia bacterium]|nr:WecB/TagA/CpsF family glycosyltransferase [Terriglobia bacterium]